MKAILLPLTIIIFAFIVVIFIFLPSVMTEKSTSNEIRVTSALIEIYKAEIAFKRKCNKRNATLAELYTAGLIQSNLSTGIVSWYQIELKVINDTFEITAIPLVYKGHWSLDERAGYR